MNWGVGETVECEDCEEPAQVVLCLNHYNQVIADVQPSAVPLVTVDADTGEMSTADGFEINWA
jgi:hypothetical protein